MKLDINKDLVNFFKFFISSYNNAILCRKCSFKMPYFKNLSIIILPYFVKKKLIRNFVIINNFKICEIFLNYNKYGLLKVSKLKLYCLRRTFYQINIIFFNKFFKNSRIFLNHNYYFIYKNSLYDLKDLKKVNINKSNIIYLVLKLF